jgi:hypothetical protein
MFSFLHKVNNIFFNAILPFLNLIKNLYIIFIGEFEANSYLLNSSLSNSFIIISEFFLITILLLSYFKYSKNNFKELNLIFS